MVAFIADAGFKQGGVSKVGGVRVKCQSQLPELADMGERQVLELHDQRMVGKDMRLLLRPRGQPR